MLAKAGMLSIPITLVILLLVLRLGRGGRRCRCSLALTAVVATMGLLALSSQIVPIGRDIMAGRSC